MYNQLEQNLRNYICQEFEKDGLPKELGEFIFDGITQDIAENWNNTRFLKWCDEMEVKFPQFTPKQLITCHEKVNNLTEKYTRVVKAFTFKGFGKK
ncbi:hypothetical protein [Brunnivagina elsteri]|uniref:Transposase n=1 Tax=Brunnivagina elsteri CCALA 953 TaxID=987040 RepID=A0A2A2TMX5_9CYAN|nr:hypothetical protein [Calothrix elsteri]PAX59871.1 hypothetical protein CK510_04795 [Calothrix elsteri CCALA 953]